MNQVRVMCVCMLLLCALTLVTAANTTIETNTSESASLQHPELPVQDSSEAIDTNALARDAITAGRVGLFGIGASADAETQLILPQVLQDTTAFLFHLPEGTHVTIDLFIILLSLFIFLYIILLDIIVEIIDQRLLRHVLALVLTLLAAILGVLSEVMLFLQSYTGTMNKYLGFLIIFFLIIICFLFLKLLTRLFHRLKRSSETENAKKEGYKMRTFFKAVGERFKRTTN